MIFSFSKYSQLKSRLKLKYRARLKQVLAAFKKQKHLPLASWIEENKTLLAEYSPLNWYFVHQLESFLFFAQIELSDSSDGMELSRDEDEVFEQWNQSEFADLFLKKLNQGASIAKASQQTLKIFEKHLISLANRHILKEDKTSASYRPHLSLGEKKVNGKLKRLLEATMEVEGKQITLRTTSIREMKEHFSRIEKALKEIKKASPKSWERFSSFTETIIPINVKQFVSYSHQDLPGVSMINLYHRDFVDLMDDLIHENGHHHLNYYLNLTKVIEEPIEAIYYSPWRRTPRPLRGIYHAYFTFFWAFKLFSDFTLSKELEHFSPAEQEKMRWRAIEEFRMLDFTFQDLKWAKKQGLISEIGWDLVSAQQRELTKVKRKIAGWEKKLKAHKKDLTALKKELNQAQKMYRKA